MFKHIAFATLCMHACLFFLVDAFYLFCIAQASMPEVTTVKSIPDVSVTLKISLELAANLPLHPKPLDPSPKVCVCPDSVK